MTKAIDLTAMKSADRKTPEIDPTRVQLQYGGQVWNEFFIRLPDGFVGDDLKDPSAWRKVQAGPRGLRKFDHVFCVAFDESWTATAIVASADRRGVVLGRPNIQTMPERYNKLLETPEYRIAWCGHGFVVERKLDGHRMTQPVANEALAERDLTQLYPRRAG